MKINIWIPIENAMLQILDYESYSTTDPDNADWVQVSISPDEFTEMLDKQETNKAITEFCDDDFEYPYYSRSKEWRVNQYNRNRAPEDHIDNIDDMEQNNQPFAD